MFLKNVSKSIAIALVSILVSTPLFNTVSAMEANNEENTNLESKLDSEYTKSDEMNFEEIQVTLDKSELDEIQKIIEDIENNKPTRTKRSTAYIGQRITAINIIGFGLVTIYTGGIILKGAIVKAGTTQFNRVKDIVEPYMIGANIPSRLKKDGNTVDVDKFTDKVKGKKAYRNPKTGWVIERDVDGHKGSKWKLKDKQGNRKASLRENGDIAGK